MPNPKVALQPMLVEADLLTWMTVHGNILLALRHPENTGESREIAENFVKRLGERLAEEGIINRAELEFCREQEKAVRR